MEGPFGVRERPEEGGDAERGAPPPPPPAQPRTSSTVTWLLGVLVVVVLAYITLNTVRTEAPGSRGVANGSQLPPFAVPLALSGLDYDANVARRPGSGPEGARPACEVRGPQILNVCELAERGPVVLAFLADRSDVCRQQVDVVDRVRARFPDVGFAVVAIRGDREDLRRTIRRRGWQLPVGYDQDGAVSNAYAVAICPTITFAYRGGRVEGTSLRLLDEGALTARVRRLLGGA